MNSSSARDREAELAELRLLHLADSALPIGALAHSFGLESLIAAELLGVRDLPEFFRGFLEEAGFLEAVFCREGFRLGSGLRLMKPPGPDETFTRNWLALNERFSATKLARESRNGSGSLGRNFLTAVSGLGDFAVVQQALRASKETHGLIHHGVAFGLGCAVLGFQDEDRAVLAFLHSWAASMISACQRLLPFGQAAATKTLWELKPPMVETMRRSAQSSAEDAFCFMPLLDWGAMEHPALTTRLFIS